MIHRAQGGVWGDAEDMERAAQVLQKHEQAVIPEYMRRLGKSDQDVMALLKAETWYTAAEAKAVGLVDAVTNPTADKGNAADMQAESWEYASQHFRNIPQNLKQRINPTKQQHDYV